MDAEFNHSKTQDGETHLMLNIMFPMKKDVRVDDWLLMDSILPTVLLTLIYLLILLIGPKLMKNRAAFEMRKAMLVYNLFQTLFSAWVFVGGAKYYVTGVYNLVCQPVDYSNNPMAIEAAAICWWFFMSKFIDFMDSFFFVLRKKYSQLSLLHIIHHSVMPAFSWMSVKFAGGGNSVFNASLNMLVHVFMYAYYFLAATGVRKEYLWWKKYLTMLQLVQFAIVILLSLAPFFLADCTFSKEISVMYLLNCVMFFVLFSQFYRSAYKKPKSQ